ncbi:hypothetical protein NDU88_001648 [Pleurodeles waltl]|uniref:Uncharacterized protein n=1 Tax=Pleurodeles waltl TaxID=8319 RepID=A0AAV7U8J0_PLEWA|nr:hypothetical protein NDU88_001648 [Pleurodeles waltl]
MCGAACCDAGWDRWSDLSGCGSHTWEDRRGWVGAPVAACAPLGGTRRPDEWKRKGERPALVQGAVWEERRAPLQTGGH